VSPEEAQPLLDELARRLEHLPADAALVRFGAWAWYRRADGQLRERVFPDQNFGGVDDDELIALLRGPEPQP
jgi:hypothetical protein